MEAGKGTGVLLLINLKPLYFGPHLDFLVGFLGIFLHDLYTVRGSATVMSVLLSAIHVLFSIFGGQWKRTRMVSSSVSTYLKIDPLFISSDIKKIHAEAILGCQSSRVSRDKNCFSVLAE